jgi:hypothetical protein
MVDLINLFSYILAGILGPALLGVSLIYRRQFQDIIQRWQKPQIVIYTILNFVISLALFVISSFFLAIYFGQIQQLKIADIPNPVLGQLGLDALLLLLGATMVYQAMHNFYTQFISRQGIYITQFDPKRLRIHTQLINWQAIKDYYVHSDYPVTQYNLLVQTMNNNFMRYVLRVPFYAQPKFRSLLGQYLDWQEERAESASSISRKFSQN